MTFLEKARKENKHLSKKHLPDDCPEDYGLEAKTECINDCEKCWNREMPNTELVKTVTLPMPPTTEPLTEKEKMIDAMSENAYNKGLEDGRNEVWEFAKRISLYPKEGGMSSMELVEIFGVGTVSKVMRLSYDEALAKLKEYEEAQMIEVGDILLIYGEKVVVTRVEEEYVYILFADGFARKEKVEEVVGDKTGKHIDIKAILEQIGE